MGAVYDVTLKARFKSKNAKEDAEKELAKRTSEYIKSKEILFSAASVSPTSLLSNFSDMMKLYLADSKQFPMSVSNKDGYKIYSNGFDASYSWERVMYEMFCFIAKYLTKNSYICIYPDEGCVQLYAKDVKEEE